MKLFSRKSRPQPAPVDPAAVAAGLRAFAADLECGFPLAVEMAGPQGELPMDSAEWAAYPSDDYRLERLTAHYREMA